LLIILSVHHDATHVLSRVSARNRHKMIIVLFHSYGAARRVTAAASAFPLASRSVSMARFRKVVLPFFRSSERIGRKRTRTSPCIDIKEKCELPARNLARDRRRTNQCHRPPFYVHRRLLFREMVKGANY